MIDKLLPHLEKVINRCLGLDPQFLPQLAALDGKLLHLQLLIADLDIFIRMNQQGVNLSRLLSDEQAVDLVISASPFSLLRMATAQGDYVHPGDYNVSIQGDAGLAQQVQRIFASLDIDWEAHIATFTGDIVAHRLGNAARKMQRWVQQTGQSLQQDMTDYLQEEVRYLPTRFETEAWISDIDELRDDSERLLARWQHLQQQIACKQ